MDKPVDSVFQRSGDADWLPRPIARGPFDGVQGGALAALLCAEAETLLASDQRVLSIETSFLRPCPLEPLSCAAKLVQRGQRLSVVEVSAVAGGKIRATAIVKATSAIFIGEVPAPEVENHNPLALPRRARPAPHGQPWLMDVMEAHPGPEIFWFRFQSRITGSESPFARALASADWIPGITRPDSWERPIVKAIPNVDLSVKAHRYPTSNWVGVKAHSHWSQTGIGTASGQLLDLTGPFGEVTASLILIP